MGWGRSQPRRLVGAQATVRPSALRVSVKEVASGSHGARKGALPKPWPPHQSPIPGRAAAGRCKQIWRSEWEIRGQAPYSGGLCLGALDQNYSLGHPHPSFPHNLAHLCCPPPAPSILHTPARGLAKGHWGPSFLGDPPGPEQTHPDHHVPACPVCWRRGNGGAVWNFCWGCADLPIGRCLSPW